MNGRDFAVKCSMADSILAKQAAEIEEMKKQLADMKALLQAKSEAKPEAPKRKGRPPKVKTDG